jgi:DNA-binding response OmpR family regulator
LPKVLIIDDDPDVLAALLAAVRRRRGWEAAGSADPGELSRLLAVEAPDLLVLDGNLGTSDADGLRLVRSLRGDPRYGKLPIVLFTGTRTAGAEAAIGLEAGADDYIVKPASPEELLARLESLLRRASRRA